jgi:hypothetical protein
MLTRQSQHSSSSFSVQLSYTGKQQTHKHQYIVNNHHYLLATMSNAGQSHVGYPALYEAQDQRNFKQSEVEEQRRHTGENVQGFLPSKCPLPLATVVLGGAVLTLG